MIEAFERVRMIAMLETLHEPRTYFLDTYFDQSETFDTASVTFDIVQHKRLLAPFTSPMHQGHLVENPSESQRVITPPYVKPKKSYTAQDMIRRQPGQSIESTAQANNRLARDTQTLMTSITRREEYMAARQLQDGQLTITGDGYNGLINFNFAADHKITLTGTDKWDDAGSDPIMDIRAWVQKIADDSGLKATRVTLGSDAATAFIGNAKVQEYMNKLKMTVGEVNVGDTVDGITVIALLFGGSVRVEQYSELFYDDVTETNKNMLDADKCIVGAPAARCERLYAAIQDLDAAENGLLEARIYAKSWVEKDPSVGFLLLQSSPLPATIEPNGFISVDVV